MIAMRRARSVVPAIAVALALAHASCRTAPERAQPVADAQAPGTERVVLATADGGARIPEDFPASIPIYAGAKTTMVTRSTSPRGKPAWSVTLESDDPRDRVASFYKASMKGFTSASDMALADTWMSVWRNAQYDVTILVAQGAAQKTAITLAVAQR
jgi:hypothetical protein